MLTTLLKTLKLPNKSSKTMNIFFTWLYQILWIFFNYFHAFNNYVSEKSFHQSSLDIDMMYQKSRYMCWFINHLDMVCENI